MKNFNILEAVKNMEPKIQHRYTILPSGMIWVAEEGFYYSDECEQWQGPFLREAEAIKASIDWCNQLNSYYVDETWRIYRDFDYHSTANFKVVAENSTDRYVFYLSNHNRTAENKEIFRKLHECMLNNAFTLVKKDVI